MSKNYKPKTFEWTCNECNYLHVEVLKFRKSKDDTINLNCNQCGSTRKIKLVEVPDASLSSDWLITKCSQCMERKECLSKDSRNVFNKRTRLIGKLGFCEDYVVDSSRLNKPKDCLYK